MKTTGAAKVKAWREANPEAFAAQKRRAAERRAIKRGRGRPTGFKPEFSEQAQKLCKLGATDYELAGFFEVDTRTIYRWKNEFPVFCQAVIVGKEAADERVARSLFNRAVGYTFESEKVFQFQGKIVRASILEHVPPDPGAAFNWLKNRKPEEWRDRSEMTIRRDVSNLSDHELEIIAAGGRLGVVTETPDPPKLN